MNENPNDDDVDTSEEPPIAELRRLPDETTEDFLDRVRRVIRRHMLGSHIVDICVIGSALVLLQVLFLATQVTTRERHTGGDV